LFLFNFSLSCVPYVASFSGLCCVVFFFVLCTLCCQFLCVLFCLSSSCVPYVASFSVLCYVFLRLVYPMLPVAIFDYPFGIL
jgi:hypothetical protein